MKKTHATLLALVSAALIIDMHFTHFVSSFGDDFVALSKWLGVFSYLNLAGALLFGFVSPSLIRAAERSPVHVIIEDNALTVNGVRSTATFSTDGNLITQPVFEQTLRHAVNAAISPSLFTIKPAAKVTVLLGTRLGLSDEDALRIDTVLHDMFMKVDMRVSSAV